jgi:hypothetical protein
MVSQKTMIFFALEYGDDMLSVVVFFEGGNYPMPAKRKDYLGFQNITIDSNNIIVEEPFALEIY